MCDYNTYTISNMRPFDEYDLRHMPDYALKSALAYNARYAASMSKPQTTSNVVSTPFQDSRVTSNGTYMHHCYFGNHPANPMRSVIG
jgi:hypothetical protein